MARFAALQKAFNAGQWSPFLDARSEIQKYPRASRLMENFVPLVQGPATFRPGFRFVARVKDATGIQRLIPFEFSVTQAYAIEMGDLYLRFFANNGSVLESSQNITGITQASPGVFSVASHGLIVDEEVLIEDVGGMTEVNNKRYKVNTVPGAGTFSLKDIDTEVALDTTSLTAYTSGGTVKRVYEVTTTYDEDDLFQIKYAQSADVMYLVHKDYAPRKLSRTADTSWTIEDIAFQDGPYLSTNTTSTTLNPSGTSGTVTVVASATTGINDDDGFKSTDVGRLIRMKQGSNWGWLKITVFNSTTSVDATVEGDNLSASSAVEDWRLGAWSTTTGYPSGVTFYEDRLFFGGGVDFPQRIDGSNTGDYENMAPTDADGIVPDDRAVSFTLNATNVNAIVWLKDDEKGLLVGTVGGEWVVRASTANEVITPANIKATRSSIEGSADIDAIRANQAVLFVQRAKKRLREMAYRFEDDGFRAPDMTVLSEDITGGGLIELAFQQQPYDLMWAPRADGKLIGFTYERDQEVTAWHQHTIGGTDALVKSVTSIPDTTGARDELWIVTSRTINGGTRKFVEYMAPYWTDDTDIEDAVFMDCAATYDGAATTTITGLDHLEGESVTILADGATHPNKTVASGSITLDRSTQVAQVGEGYNGNIQTMKIDQGTREGGALMKPKRIHRTTLRLWETVNLMVGTTEATIDRVIFRTSADNLGEAIQPFTGDKEHTPNSTYDREGQVYLRQDQPLPCTVIAMMMEMETIDP